MKECPIRITEPDINQEEMQVLPTNMRGVITRDGAFNYATVTGNVRCTQDLCPLQTTRSQREIIIEKSGNAPLLGIQEAYMETAEAIAGDMEAMCETTKRIKNIW